MLVSPYPRANAFALWPSLDGKGRAWIERGFVLSRRRFCGHYLLLGGGNDVREFVPRSTVEHTTSGGFAEAVQRRFPIGR
jgi:hypothetical protein